MKELKVKLTFIEPILGTSPANPDIYREFIGSHAPDAASVEDEVAALGADAVAEKSMTIFPRLDDGTPFLYDYQIKGFFKDSCGMLARVGAGNDYTYSGAVVTLNAAGPAPVSWVGGTVS